MKKRIFKSLLLFALLVCFIQVDAANIYVNDVLTGADIFTTAAGNDVSPGNGSSAHPYATLAKALAVAQPGDIIYVDAGSYSQDSHIINDANITIIGAGTGNTVFDVNAAVKRFATISANNVKIKNMMLREYYMDVDGQVFLINNAATGIVFENIIVKDCPGANTGGANVYVTANSSLTVNRCLFSCSGWNANQGGAILVESSTLVVNNSIFKDNHNFQSYGGAIELAGSSPHVTINETTFDHCSAYKGGAIYQGSGTLVVNKSCFNTNYSEGDASSTVYGGGAFASSAVAGSSCTFTNCSFTNNQHNPLFAQFAANASGDGSCVMFRGASGTFNFNKCSFSNIHPSPSSYDKGQDFFINGSASLAGTISNCSFSGSTDANGGNKTNIYNDNLSISNLSITNSGIYTATNLTPQSLDLIPIRNAVAGFGTWIDANIAGTTTINMLSPTADYTPMRTAVTGFTPVWTDVAVAGTTTVNLLGASTLRTPLVTGRTMATAGGWVDGTPVSTGGTTNIIMTNNACSFTSPTLDFTVAGNEWLIFDAIRSGTAGVANTITVSISTDNGVNWTVLGTRLPTTTTNVTQNKFDLSAYSGNQVKIKFQTLSATGTIGAGIDNIYIYSVGTVASTTTPTLDFSVPSSYKYLSLKIAALSSPGASTVYKGMNDLNVSISTDNGSTYTFLQTLTPTTTTSTLITPIDISTYSSSQLRIKFEGISAGLIGANQTGVLIDDIKIYSSNISSIVTPTMDFTGKAVKLSYLQAALGGTSAAKNTITVSISTDNGLNYSVVGTTNVAGTQLMDLSSYTGSQTKVKFETLGADGAIGASIDDINFYYFSSPIWDATYSGPSTNCTDATNIVACGATINCATETNPPVIIACAPDTVLVGACNAILPDFRSLVSAFDDCTFTLSQLPAPGTTISGVNSVTITATDQAGNTSSCTFTVTTGSGGVTAPIVGTITQPTCSLATGSVVLSGLPAGNWTINPGGITGSGTTTTITGLTAGATYNFSVTDATPCTSGTSANVVINAQPITPAPTTSSATQTFCAIDSLTFADISIITLPTGTVTWYTALTNGTAIASTDLLTNGTYYASQTVGGCESVLRLQVTVVVSNPSPPTYASASHTFCAIDSATVADLTALVSATGTVTWYPSSLGGVAFPNTAALVTGAYYATQTIAGCESVNRLLVNITINNPDAPTIVSASQSFCAIDSAVVSDLTALVNATGTVIWYPSALGGVAFSNTAALVNGTYYATQTIAGCESVNRLLVNVTINNPSAPTGSSTQAFCENMSHTVADLTASGSGIQWYSSATGGTLYNNTDILVNGNTYYATQTIGSCESVLRLSVTVTLKPTPIPNLGTDITICSLVPTTLTAHDGDTYLWTGGASTPSINIAITSTATYSCTVTKNGCVAIEDVIVNVSSSLEPHITPTFPAICTGTNTTLAVDIAGSGITYDWNNGAAPSIGNTQSISVAPDTTTTYYVTVTDASGCSGVQNIAISVQSSINVSSSPAAICFGKSATLTAGSDPTESYIWDDGTPGSTTNAITVSPSVSTTYNVTVTNGVCTANGSFPVTVNNLPPAFAGADQTICDGKQADLLASGGTSYLWNNGVYIDANPVTLNSTTSYTVTVTDGNGCSNTDGVNVIVNPLPATLTGASIQTYCEIDSATVADLVVVGQTAGTTLEWYTLPNGGALYNSTDALVDNNHYYASLVNDLTGCVSLIRFDVTAKINKPLAPTYGSSTQSFCAIDSAKVSDLIAIGSNIQWYPSLLGGTAYNPNDALHDGYTYYASQTIGVCESVNRLAITVTINDPQAPDYTSNAQSFCAMDSATISDLVANGSNIQWYPSLLGGTAYNSNDVLLDGATYYASQTIGGCESVNRLAITVTINNPSAPIYSSNTQTFCAIDSAKISDLIATGSNIQWYPSVTGGTAYSSNASLVNGSTYYASQTIGGCESVNRLSITVTINNPSAPTGYAQQFFCANTAATVADLVAVGSNIQWYSSANGGAPYNSTDTLVNGNTYYASQTVGVCESVFRLLVTVTIYPNPVLNSPLTPNSICSGATFNYIPTSIVADVNFSWSRATIVGITEPGTNGADGISEALTNTTQNIIYVTYVLTSTANGCSSSQDVIVGVYPLPEIKINGTTSICEGVTTSLIASGGTQYIWSTTETTSAITISPTALTIYMVTGTDANGCSSTASHSVDIIMNPNVTLTTNNPNNEMYEGQSLIFTANPDGYTNYDFYVGSTLVQSGSSNVFETGSLKNGDRVSVIATNLGCNSDDDFVDVKVIPFPNAFTPDGDGVNDLFLKGVDLTILNRWGQELYKGIEGWDGKYKGELVNEGTYFFIVTYKDLNGLMITKNGSVTLTY